MWDPFMRIKLYGFVFSKTFGFVDFIVTYGIKYAKGKTYVTSRSSNKEP